ncbi:hypothetical protein J2X19_000073 [Rhodoferax ferrireducens]|uniref:Uncharacterized protein n=1 Tax=Rhodoferax ferrireducens TaxID=192843 RepID=A0ABU2C251_9BURK|nr:hypothetical protein [Rhodoferax ferrireducens]MDR7375415.1 hypothetical protein [Rhodoferax ferrireducens]
MKVATEGKGMPLPVWVSEAEQQVAAALAHPKIIEEDLLLSFGSVQTGRTVRIAATRPLSFFACTL